MSSRRRTNRPLRTRSLRCTREVTVASIETTDDQEWDGDLAELRLQVVEPAYERVDHIMAIHPLDAGSMRAHLDLYRQGMRRTKT